MQALDSMITDDVLLHSEVLGIPVQDWSIGDIFNVHLFKMLDIGGGVDLTHLLSVYPGPYNTLFYTSCMIIITHIDSANSQNMIIVKNVTTIQWLRILFPIRSIGAR